jgi:hypothetical protein
LAIKSIWDIWDGEWGCSWQLARERKGRYNKENINKSRFKKLKYQETHSTTNEDNRFSLPGNWKTIIFIPFPETTKKAIP